LFSNFYVFFFSSRRRHTRSKRDWSSDVCSSDLASPQSGINAGSFLALFLDNYEFLGSAKQFIHVAAAYVHEDFYGEKLGVAYEEIGRASCRERVKISVEWRGVK